MKKSFLIAATTGIICLATSQLFAQTQDTTRKTTTTAITNTATPAAPALDVAGVLTAVPDYSTSATAVKNSGLETALKSTGPFTVFAPNNAAFSKLSKGRQDSLMKDPTKLAAVLKGHVVTGHYNKAEIIKALTAGKGKATLITIDGQSLTLSISPNKTLLLTNAAGTSAEVTMYDMNATNGVVNGINGVLLPSK